MSYEQQSPWRETHRRGAWPFVTLQFFEHELGHHHRFAARPHRKQIRRGGSAGLRLRHAVREVERWAFVPGRLNWWIGSIFAVGAFCFALGGALSLWHGLARALGVTDVNLVFFVGSIPFTTAAYLQLFQAANMPPSHPDAATERRRVRVFGWFPTHPGWLSCALQFPGTVLFNFNTFGAMIPGLGWWGSELAVWVPNVIGSILFLASGWLAWIETCHAHFAWRPGRIPWQIAFWNLMGCVNFMLAAVFAVVLFSGEVWMPVAATLFTMLGGICFFVGSVLMLPEDAA